MRRPGSKQRRFVILLLAVLAFGIAYYGGNRYQQSELPQISGVTLIPPMPAPEFELTDQQGHRFTQEQLLDHWSLLLLDPNPASESTTLLYLARIHNRLAVDPELQRQLRFIYIPRRSMDSGDIADIEMGAGFFALSGDSEQIDETFSRFGMSGIEKRHTLTLIDTDARMLALFTGDQDAATIAADLITLMTSNHR